MPGRSRGERKGKNMQKRGRGKKVAIGIPKNKKSPEKILASDLQAKPKGRGYPCEHLSLKSTYHAHRGTGRF